MELITTRRCRINEEGKSFGGLLGGAGKERAKDIFQRHLDCYGEHRKNQIGIGSRKINGKL
jgi:hypothetical protein